MRVVFGALIWCVCLALLGIPILILVLVKQLVTAITCRRSENAQYEKLAPLKGDDGGSGYPQWKIPYNLGFCLKVRGNIDVNEFRNHFSSTFNLNSENDPYDKFFSYFLVRGGYMFRAISRGSLDLSQSICDVQLEESESLENFLVRWMLVGYPEKRSRWQVAIIPLPENRTSVAFKMDHNLIDVYSFVHILDKLTGSRAPYLVKDFRENFWGQLKQVVAGPTHVGVLKGLPRDQNPFRCMYPVSSPERVEETEWKRQNGFCNFTILVGAIRRFLVEVMNIKEDELPLEIKLGGSLPWPRHPAMNENMYGPDRLQNQWTGGLYSFPLRESDALLRMQKIEEEYVKFFDIGTDKFLKLIFVRTFKLLPARIASSLIKPSNVTDMGVASNLITGIGADTYSLLTCPVERIHPLLGIPDNIPYVPMSCFTFSHSGRMEVAFGANPQSIFRDKQRLDLISHKLVHDELQHILSVTKSMCM